MIGLACAWRAAQRGLRVCVLERGESGHGATHAAAGVLASATDVEPGREAFVPLAHRSAGLYPGFAAELAEVTGLDIGYERSGTLYVAFDRDELEAIRHEHEFHRRLGLSSAWLSAGECRALAPGLAPQCAGGLHAPHEGQVEPRTLAVALAAALRAAGGELRTGADVVDGLRDGGRLCGVVTADGTRVPAGRVLLAGGAWSAACALGQEPVPVRPVKGQIVRLRGPADARPAECMIRTERVYIVPRRSGEVVVGASVEERGFDTTVTAGGVYELLREAYRALPDVAEL
ncbi:MAG TPA: glycine oxidase ThiO, partial [Gaiellaceae bacterium]|nr:glycine oxidase ThiO [Gaiellaceae bacterium]